MEEAHGTGRAGSSLHYPAVAPNRHLVSRGRAPGRSLRLAVFGPCARPLNALIDNSPQDLAGGVFPKGKIGIGTRKWGKRKTKGKTHRFPAREGISSGEEEGGALRRLPGCLGGRPASRSSSRLAARANPPLQRCILGGDGVKIYFLIPAIFSVQPGECRDVCSRTPALLISLSLSLCRDVL